MPPLRESYQAVGLQAFEEMQPEYNLIAGGWGGSAVNSASRQLLCPALCDV